MTHHHLSVPCTKPLKDYIKTYFHDEFEGYDYPIETVRMGWGFDHMTCGYFIALYVISPDDEDLYIEDGLMTGSKSKVLDKLERYGILEFVRQAEPDKFNMLVLDLPF
jgi:hypothetical protein